MRIPPHIKIKTVRKQNKLSQQYMADKLNISQFAYSKIERNETQLNWNKITTIASILGINVWDLVDETKSLNEDDLNTLSPTSTIDLLKQLFDKYEKERELLNREIQNLKDQLKFQQ
ncbi:MAG: helix-turn-helix transcriptional regulator [Flavobacteriales bacterium]|nr:helix-turn-helix transcriptional regulator [Flavobacteriales bacterium]